MKISLEEYTDVFSIFDITSITQSPEGFLELLTKHGEHTYGSLKGSTLTISSVLRELPINEIDAFDEELNNRLSN